MCAHAAQCVSLIRTHLAGEVVAQALHLIGKFLARVGLRLPLEMLPPAAPSPQ